MKAFAQTWHTFHFHSRYIGLGESYGKRENQSGKYNPTVVGSTSHMALGGDKKPSCMEGGMDNLKQKIRSSQLRRK